MNKLKFLNGLRILFFIICLWTAGTSIVQALKCPKMTDAERFLNIPNSFILNFKYCDE